MKLPARPCAVLLLGCIALGVYADEAAAPIAGPDAAPIVKKLPVLAIRWDCYGCQINEKVAPQIAAAYAAEATDQGYTLNTSDTANVSIITFRQRPPVIRIAFGIFSGKDRLGVKIKYRGRTIEASDYSMNAFEGMNVLCKSVGHKIFEGLVSVVQGSQGAPETAQ